MLDPEDNSTILPLQSGWGEEVWGTMGEVREVWGMREAPIC